MTSDSGKVIKLYYNCCLHLQWKEMLNLGYGLLKIKIKFIFLVNRPMNSIGGGDHWILSSEPLC